MATNLSVVLNVSNVEKSQRFYEDLGFRTKLHADEGVEMATATMGSATIELFPKDSPTADPEVRRWLANPLGCGVVVNIETRQVDKIYANARRAGAEIEMALEVQPWGRRAFMMDDPDGYVLVFGEPARGSERATTRTRTRGRGAARPRTVKRRR